MLSKRIQEHFEVLINPLVKYFNVFNYFWNSDTNLFEKLSPEKRKPKLYYFNRFLVIVWIIFHIIQLIRYYLSKDFNSVVFLVACAIALSVVTLCVIICTQWEEHIFPGLNCIITFLRQINVQYMPEFDANEDKFTRIVDYCTFGLTLSIISMAVTTSLYFMLSPDAPHLFGNLFQTNAWYLCPLIYVYPLYTSFYCYANFAAALVLIFRIGIVYVLLIVRELHVGRQKHQYRANDSFRRSYNIIKIFRTVELLQTQINYLAGKLLIPYQTIVTLLFVFCGYQVIRHMSDMELLPLIMIVTWAVAGPIVWGLVLTMGGYLHSNGLKILHSWRRHDWASRKQNSEMKKFVKSCRPIMICNGKMFVVRRVTLMIFVQGLTRGLVRALLTLNM